MSTRLWRTGLLVVPLLLVGCATAGAAPGHAAGHAAPSSARSAADGEAQPPETATMVCGDEIKEDAAGALGTDSPPTESTWDGSTYTCRYTLPAGPMTLAVHVAGSPGGAQAWFDERRSQLGGTRVLQGLGDASYGTGDGVVVVRRDSFTLEVDTTGLPEVFGQNEQRRDTLAYEMATVVLGCWTGHE